MKIERVDLEKPGLTILKTLVYFDIFSYPLTEEEIWSFSGHRISPEVVRCTLRELIFGKLIFKFDEFYSVHNDPSLVDKRVQGNRRAKQLIPKAGRIGAFLYKFPFVRAVAVSGSLSKNYADARADIDFFIITSTNRLWVARTFLHLFKKLTFLVGQQHFYCMNYFIDESSLLINEQNIYSATEVVTLLPMAGNDMMSQFFRINDWTEDWLPNHRPNRDLNARPGRFSFKKLIETFLDKKKGDRLDDFLYRWTTRRWEKKERLGRKNLKGKVMNLVTDKHSSKSDPGAFQEKIVAMYERKIDQLKYRHPQYFE